jgi:hypothetical protein
VFQMEMIVRATRKNYRIEEVTHRVTFRSVRVKSGYSFHGFGK